MIETPPNDAARPVAWIAGTPFGLGLSIPENADHIQLNVGERIALYTAADYDALRAEVALTQAEFDAVWTEAIKYRARAEAAEAKVASFRRAAEKVINDTAINSQWTRHHLNGALNEGGE